MTEQAEWTCGKGLAEHAAIPAKIAEFLRALGENLGAHISTIDLGDANGREEHEAYVDLSKEYMRIAARLSETAKRMRGYRDLPAARHHEDALGDPRLVEAFEVFVALERELAGMIGESAENDARLLRQIQEE